VLLPATGEDIRERQLPRNDPTVAHGHPLNGRNINGTSDKGVCVRSKSRPANAAPNAIVNTAESRPLRVKSRHRGFCTTCTHWLSHRSNPDFGSFTTGGCDRFSTVNRKSEPSDVCDFAKLKKFLKTSETTSPTRRKFNRGNSETTECPHWPESGLAITDNGVQRSVCGVQRSVCTAVIPR
jgi:hypothetical protein